LLIFLIRAGNLYKAISSLLPSVTLPNVALYRCYIASHDRHEHPRGYNSSSAIRLPRAWLIQFSSESSFGRPQFPGMKKATHVTSTSSIIKYCASWNPHVEVNHGSLDKSVDGEEALVCGSRARCTRMSGPQPVGVRDILAPSRYVLFICLRARCLRCVDTRRRTAGLTLRSRSLLYVSEMAARVCFWGLFRPHDVLAPSITA
jgi:hypothetical protein